MTLGAALSMDPIQIGLRWLLPSLNISFIRSQVQICAFIFFFLHPSYLPKKLNLGIEMAVDITPSRFPITLTCSLLAMYWLSAGSLTAASLGEVRLLRL